MDLKLFCQVKIFITIFVACGVAGASNLLFDFQESNQNISRVYKADSTDASFFKKADNSIEFEITGDFGSRATWFIPIDSTIVSDCKIHFEVSSMNIKSAKTNPNLFLMLDAKRVSVNSEQKEPAANLRPITIPIYSAEGEKDSVIGRIPFSTLEKNHIIKGLYVDMVLSNSRIGKLRISKLQLSFLGNIPTHEAINESLAKESSANVEVRSDKNGFPGIYIDNKSLSRLGAWKSANKSENKTSPNKLKGYDINRMVLNFGAYNEKFPDYKPVWNYPDYIAYDYIDESLVRCRTRPDSFIFVDVLLCAAPEWWFSLQKQKNNQPIVLSDLNPEWLDYCRSSLKYLIAYMRESNYDNFIGCSLITNMEGYGQQPYGQRDAHPNYQRSFQEWLKTKYGSDSELQKAWKQDSISINSVSPVPKKRWVKGTISAFIHPLIGGVDTDSYLFYNESWAEFIMSLAHHIKIISKQNCLTGIVGGSGLYMNQLWRNDYNLTGNTLVRLLESKYIDYFDMAIDNTDSRVGYGVSGMEGLLADAVKKRRKLFFVHDHANLSRQNKLLSRQANDITHHIQINRRNFVANLINSTSLYFIKYNISTSDHSNLTADFETFQLISAKAKKLNSTKQSEVAFILDPDVFLNIAPDNDLPVEFDKNQLVNTDVRYQSRFASSYFYLFQMARIMWNRIGVPYDVVLIDDLNPDNYKSIILFNTFYINEPRLKRINDFKNRNRTLITLWADGFISDKYLSVKGVESISNIALKMNPYEKRFFLKPHDNLREFLDRNITDNIGWPYAFREPTRSMKVKFSPTFEVIDDDATILATFLDGGESAMALKIFPEWRSFYSGSPFVNPEIMRQLVRNSGVHVYSNSNDLYFINSNFIGIHTLENGMRTIKLPVESKLFELFRKQEIPSQKTHYLEMEGAQTYLFFIGDKDVWDGL